MKETMTLVFAVASILGLYGLRCSYVARQNRPVMIVPSNPPTVSPAEKSPANKKRSLAAAVAVAAKVAPIIERNRQSCELPKFAIDALIEHETDGTWNPKAFNPERDSSCYLSALTEAERLRCGSRGLMQVVYRWHGDGFKMSDLDNPTLNIDLGTQRKLCPCYKKCKGDLRCTYTCWNGSGKKARVFAGKVIRRFERMNRQG